MANFSRREFFAKMGLTAGLTGLGFLSQNKQTYAESESGNGDFRSNGNFGVQIEWLGHGSFFFISHKGTTILLDPWIRTNPKCPGKYKNIDNFKKVDLVLWTHGHVDHFMLADAKSIIEKYNPQIIAPWELNFFIKSQIPQADCQTFKLGNKGATADFSGIKITMTEAFHSAGAQLTGFEGTNHFVGEAVGYILEFENGLKVYHSGDTALMSEMKTIIGEFYKPDIAILPIGGIFTMGPKEAAFACQLIKPKAVIPEHYGTFPVLAQSTNEFGKYLKQYAPDLKMLDATPGIPISL